MRIDNENRRPVRSLIFLAAGAIALRLLMFAGRGDYIAFDEAWYILLGQSLWSGEGYRLTGLRHVTLSPLFPILAGGVGRLIGDPVWGGRIVAAVTSGLLVIPCWSIFRRIGGSRTAWLATGLVAVLPSMAPFVAPEWMGWDLWVGAEPVYHLFLFTGIALVLKAWDRKSPGGWALAGAALGLAYLARPETVVVAGLLGVLVAGFSLARRGTAALVGPTLLAAGFALVSLPYWVYLHDATGRWSLTGRVVAVAARAESSGPRSSEVIERMLWQGRHGAYVRTLFRLHPSGTRMASTYWGVPEVATPSTPGATVDAAAAKPGSAGDGSSAVPSVEVASPEVSISERNLPSGIGSAASVGGAVHDVPAVGTPQDGALPAPLAGGETEVAGSPRAVSAPAVSSGAAEQEDPSRPALYARTLGKILSWPLWLPIVIGIVARRRRRDRFDEVVVAVPLVTAAILVALIVATDPRTQLFVVPIAAYYGARGIRVLGVVADRRLGSGTIRRGFIAGFLAFVCLGWAVIEDARRLYLGLTVETPQMLWATEHRRAGEAVRDVVAEDEAVMSWHPAVAIHARRPWRVLPLGSFPQIIDYANAIGCRHIIFSMYNPSPIPAGSMPRPYLLVELDPAIASSDQSRVVVEWLGERLAVGRVVAE